MPYIILYKFPPENGVRFFLEKNLEEAGLRERKINFQVIQGHPLFHNSNNSEGNDKFFPAIGVEWITDTRKGFIGQNFTEFMNSDSLRMDFQNYKKIPTEERAVSDDQLDRLTKADRLQRFIYLVESRVIVAGFTSGGTGRSTLRALYEMTDSVLEGVCHDIMKEFQGVKIEVEPNNEMNIASEQWGFPVWGFEIGLKIIQPRMTVRSIPHYPEDEIKAFDVYLSNSKTVFRTKNSFFNFDDVKGQN